MGEELVGRAAEYARIGQFLASDSGGLALIGEAGVGKTALLDATRASALSSLTPSVHRQNHHIPGRTDMSIATINATAGIEESSDLHPASARRHC